MMHLNVIGMIAVVFAVVAFIANYTALRHRSPGTRWAFVGAYLILSIPSLLFVIYYLHILPEEPWFYSLRSFPGSEFFAIFLGCAGGAFATFLPRFLLGFPLFGVILLGIFPYLKPFLSPLDYNTFQDHWQGNACLQSTSSTCGPASVASALKSLGVSSSERDVAEAAFSYTGGTEVWYLARYVRAQGFRPTFLFNKELSATVDLPAIVGVRVIGGMGHFIAILSRDDKGLLVADPMVGEEWLSLQEFQKRYRCTGFIMTIGKS